MEQIILKASDLYQLKLNLYEVDNPKGFFQIIHGMEEHQDRYTFLALFLNSLGYTVVTSNIRGHGEVNSPHIFFKEKKGFLQLLEDQKTITKYMFSKYSINKINIFAHSMGSIILRNLLKSESGNYERVILSGFPTLNNLASLGILLTNIVKLFKSPKDHSKFIESLSTGSFNKCVKNPKTNFDWLSYNEKNIESYLNDPLCGQGFSIQAYNDLFHLVRGMKSVKKLENINSSLPILLLWGLDDPCVGGKKGSQKSINALKKHGFNNLKNVSFKNMRHEIINENDSKLVLKEIEDFIK